MTGDLPRTISILRCPDGAIVTGLRDGVYHAATEVPSTLIAAFADGSFWPFEVVRVEHPAALSGRDECLIVVREIPDHLPGIWPNADQLPREARRRRCRLTTRPQLHPCRRPGRQIIHRFPDGSINRATAPPTIATRSEMILASLRSSASGCIRPR